MVQAMQPMDNYRNYGSLLLGCVSNGRFRKMESLTRFDDIKVSLNATCDTLN